MMKNQMTFSQGDMVVYPAHGVGRVTDVEDQTIAGHTLRVFVISFEHKRMTVRLPVAKAQSAGLRSLTAQDDMERALKALKTKIKTKKSMWSRRAQEYEAKINSGNPASLAEVVRELYKDSAVEEQTYSERQIYQTALERLSHEIAAIEGIELGKAEDKVKSMLSAVA